MNQCINCGKRPSNDNVFDEEYLSGYVNRFCQDCVSEIVNDINIGDDLPGTHWLP